MNKCIKKQKKQLERELVGMAMAERLLAERHPRFALSRFQLRRLCIGRVLPCVAVPSGTQVRYMVRVVDVLAALMAMEQVAV